MNPTKIFLNLSLQNNEYFLKEKQPPEDIDIDHPFNTEWSRLHKTEI